MKLIPTQQNINEKEIDSLSICHSLFLFVLPGDIEIRANCKLLKVVGEVSNLLIINEEFI